MSSPVVAEGLSLHLNFRERFLAVGGMEETDGKNSQPVTMARTEIVSQRL